MWTAIATIAGLVSTLLAWFLNPARKRQKDIKEQFELLEKLYQERDEALEKNNSDKLSTALFHINVVRGKIKNLLL
jgi:hypothetical protein